MAGLRVLVAAGMAGAALSIQLEAGARQQSSIKSTDASVAHSLTICNAYTSLKTMEVFSITRNSRLSPEPIEYRQCRELSVDLQEGERLDFKSGGLSVGTFHATGIPRTPASLLLIPHRRGNKTLAAVFDSHVFSDDRQTAQLAVVDTYMGSSAGDIHIHESGKRVKKGQEEGLAPNSVLALKAGEYQVTLDGAEGKVLSTVPVKIGYETKHVVLRVGGDGAFEQELVVFPGAKASAQESSAVRVCPLVAALSAAAACVVSAA